MKSPPFKKDQKLQQIAEAYTLDAIDFARDHFGVELDRSEGSVKRIEEMLHQMHSELVEAKPSQERIYSFAKMFGSYVGEVFRQHHGGQWGVATIDVEPIPAIKAEAGAMFWPWGKVQGRLVNGEEDNVWLYYTVLRERIDKAGETPTPDGSPIRKSFWSRLFGR